MTADDATSNDLQVLYDALTATAGADGRTRVSYDEALRSAGYENWEAERVERAVRGLVDQGLLAVRGAGYKFVGAAAAAAAAEPTTARKSTAATTAGRGGRGRGAAKRAAARRGRTAGARTAGGRSAGAAGSRAGRRTGRRSVPPVGTTSHNTSPSGGSPHLAETLNDLLTQMTSEVETVSALSARIDDSARELQGMLAEYVERIATLARLRSIADAGPLAQFLDQELRPDRPTELTALDESSGAAQRAEV